MVEIENPDDSVEILTFSNAISDPKKIIYEYTAWANFYLRCEKYMGHEDIYKARDKKKKPRKEAKQADKYKKGNCDMKKEAIIRGNALPQ